VYNYKIGNKKYKSVERWDEITIKKAIEVLKVIDKKIPVKLRNYYDLLTSVMTATKEQKIKEMQENVNDHEIYKANPAFYGLMIEQFSDIPKSVVEKMDWMQRTQLYKQYFEKFVIGCMFYPIDFEPTLKDFTHNDEAYLIPSDKIVIDTVRPMGNESAFVFTEATDLMLAGKQLEKGNFDFVANIIAIVCRPEGETYNEDKSLERAKTFDGLSMSIWWHVFFYLIERCQHYEKTMETCLQEEELKRLRLHQKVI